jgi:two-component system, chemotaxis family, sensor kinase CheA
MDKKDDEFLKRINETFRIEAQEHLNAFSKDLIDLEKKQSQERYAEIIETMFRDIHSLKGAARSVDQKEAGSICQSLESVLSALKRKEINLSPESIALFYKTLDCLTKLIKGSGSEQTVADHQYQRELIRKLKEIAEGTLTIPDIIEPIHSEEVKSSEVKNVSVVENITGSDIHKIQVPKSPETVRMQISKLDPLLLQAEELIQSKKAISQRISELEEINSCINGCKAESMKWKGNRSMGSPALHNEWSEGNVICLNKLEGQIEEFTRSMERDQYNLNSLIDSHLDAMRMLLLLPVSSLVEVFPGMIREISREQNKEVVFVIRGAALEIDKRILEELKDPLIHLIRNCIDHGIDTPDKRILNNKEPKGNIVLSFTAKEGGMIEISLSDDGNGINYEQVLKAAVKSGNLNSNDAGKLNQKEILSLIYQSGVSTSPIITDISGRGMGMSVVREKVDKLNGRITIETEVNKGTTFHIVLPVKLSTHRGILIRTGKFMFILPTLNVERVMTVDPEDIKTVENNETILIEDQILSVADLGNVLGLPEHKHEGSDNIEQGVERPDLIRLVILVSDEQRIAFRFDEGFDEQQVLVKSLGKLLKRVRNISGATILGSGKVVPVLHVPDLIKSALKSSEKIKSIISEEETTDVVRKILVADDSITSRTLIRNILETAGYQVSTAVDGTDAFTKALSSEFDLLLSDVDMPRMNGFELIAKIRHDKKLNGLPAILITALGSREDQERGIEVGADAYIIKSNFDQTTLLEIIKKLI